MSFEGPSNSSQVVVDCISKTDDQLFSIASLVVADGILKHDEKFSITSVSGVKDEISCKSLVDRDGVLKEDGTIFSESLAVANCILEEDDKIFSKSLPVTNGILEENDNISSKSLAVANGILKEDNEICSKVLTVDDDPLNVEDNIVNKSLVVNEGSFKLYDERVSDSVCASLEQRTAIVNHNDKLIIIDESIPNSIGHVQDENNCPAAGDVLKSVENLNATKAADIIVKSLLEEDEQNKAIVEVERQDKKEPKTMEDNGVVPDRVVDEEEGSRRTIGLRRERGGGEGGEENRESESRDGEGRCEGRAREEGEECRGGRGGGRGRRKQAKPVRVLSIIETPEEDDVVLDFDKESLDTKNLTDDNNVDITMEDYVSTSLSTETSKTNTEQEYPTAYHRLGSELQQEAEESTIERRQSAFQKAAAAAAAAAGAGKQTRRGGSICENNSNETDNSGQSGHEVGLYSPEHEESTLTGSSSVEAKLLETSDLRDYSKMTTTCLGDMAGLLQQFDLSSLFERNGAREESCLPLNLATGSHHDRGMNSSESSAHDVYRTTKAILAALATDQKSGVTGSSKNSGQINGISSPLYFNSDLLGGSSSAALATGGVDLTDDYCDWCQKHFCNKYYLRKHKLDVHGVGSAGDIAPPISSSISTSSCTTSSSMSAFQTSLPFLLSGLQSTSGDLSSSASNSRHDVMTSQFASSLLSNQPSLMTSLPIVLPPYSLNSAVTSSFDGLMTTPSASQASLLASGLNMSNLLPGLTSMSSLMPGLTSMSSLMPGLSGMMPGLTSVSGLMPGMSSMSNLMPGLSSMPGLIPGLSNMSNLVPDLTNMASLMFLNPFLSPLALLQTGSSPFLQGVPGANFASSSLNTLAELQNASNSSVGLGLGGLLGGVGLPTEEQPEPGAVDSLRSNLLFKFDASSLTGDDHVTRCDICLKEFCSSYFVKVHKRDKHGIPLQTEVGGVSQLTSSSKASLRGPSPTSSGTGTGLNLLGNHGNVLAEKKMNEVKQERDTGSRDGSKMPSPSSLESECVMCKKQFTNRYSLMMHLLNAHNIVKPEGFGLASELLQLDKLNGIHRHKEINDTGLKYASNSTSSSNTTKGGTAPPSASSMQNSSKLSDRVACDICNKEVCNKYFLKTHKMKVHGLDSHQAEMSGGYGGGGGGGGGGSGGGLDSSHNNKSFSSIFEAAVSTDTKQRLDGFSIPILNGDDDPAAADIARGESLLGGAAGDLMASFYAMLAERELSNKQSSRSNYDGISSSSKIGHSSSERDRSSSRRHRHHQNMSSADRMRRSLARGEGDHGAGSDERDEMMTTLGLIASHKEEAEALAAAYGGGGRMLPGAGGAGSQLQNIALNLGLQKFVAAVNGQDSSLKIPLLGSGSSCHGSVNGSQGNGGGFGSGGSGNGSRHRSSRHHDRTGSSSTGSLTGGGGTTNRGGNGGREPTEDDLIKSGIDPEAYCEICQKEFCSKYFLKTHRIKIHGIGIGGSTSNGGEAGGGVAGGSLGSLQQQNIESDLLKMTYGPLALASGLNEIISSGQIAKNSLMTSSIESLFNSTAVASALLSSNSRGLESNGVLQGGGPNVVGSSRSRDGAGSTSAPSHSSRVTCEICGKELCNKYFLKTHMSKLHGITQTYGSGNAVASTSDSTTGDDVSLTVESADISARKSDTPKPLSINHREGDENDGRVTECTAATQERYEIKMAAKLGKSVIVDDFMNIFDDCEPKTDWQRMQKGLIEKQDIQAQEMADQNESDTLEGFTRGSGPVKRRHSSGSDEELRRAKRSKHGAKDLSIAAVPELNVVTTSSDVVTPRGNSVLDNDVIGSKRDAVREQCDDRHERKTNITDVVKKLLPNFSVQSSCNESIRDADRQIDSSEIGFRISPPRNDTSIDSTGTGTDSITNQLSRSERITPDKTASVESESWSEKVTLSGASNDRDHVTSSYGVSHQGSTIESCREGHNFKSYTNEVLASGMSQPMHESVALKIAVLPME